MPSAILEIQDVHTYYGHVHALKGVSFFLLRFPFLLARGLCIHPLLYGSPSLRVLDRLARRQDQDDQQRKRGVFIFRKLASEPAALSNTSFRAVSRSRAKQCKTIRRGPQAS